MAKTRKFLYAIKKINMYEKTAETKQPLLARLYYYIYTGIIISCNEFRLSIKLFSFVQVKKLYNIK